MIAERAEPVQIWETGGEEEIAVGSASAVDPVGRGLAEVAGGLLPRGEDGLLGRTALLGRAVEPAGEFEAEPVAGVDVRGERMEAREQRLAIGEARDAHVELGLGKVGHDIGGGTTTAEVADIDEDTGELVRDFRGGEQELRETEHGIAAGTGDLRGMGGTATAGGDYTAVGDTLTFAPGETTKTVSLPILDDTSYEGGETVILTLSASVNAVLGSPASHTLTVEDDEDACYVTTTADSGVGSLRAAFGYANAHPRTHVIFNIPLADSGYEGGVFTIQPLTALPILTATSASIDGGTQTTFTGDTNAAGPEVVLNGALAGSAAIGIQMRGSSCLLRALVVNGFGRYGILVDGGPGQHRIEGCYVGTDPAGTVAVPNATAYDWLSGIGIVSGSDTVIGGMSPGAGNLVSGNGSGTALGAGVSVAWTNACRVEGNLIGTDRTGTQSLANTYTGVNLFQSGIGNVVGGDCEAARNVISGNGTCGVLIHEVSDQHNTVIGNYIGTTIDGGGALGNGGYGVWLFSSTGVVIGGSTAGRRNTISGNRLHGVYLYGSEATGNEVIGNYIGADTTGTAAIPPPHSLAASMLASTTSRET